MESVNLDKLTQAFDASEIKQRPGGGGKQLSYVPGETVIKRLNEATGNRWDLSVEAIWSDTTPGGQTIMFARVKLTLQGLGSREHIGVQVIRQNDGEDIYKGSITDALKKAATLFGVGLELYEDAPAQPPPQRGDYHDQAMRGEGMPVGPRKPPPSNISAVRSHPPEEPTTDGPWQPPEDVKNTAHLVGILNQHYGWKIAADAKLGSIIADLYEEYRRDPDDLIPFDTDREGKQTRYPSTVWRWIRERATPTAA